MSERKLSHGWIPDLPDHRDHVFAARIAPAALPPSVDLRKTGSLPPVYDQGELGSCTANAIAAAIEFDRRKQKLPDFMPSRLFIYYNERSMEHTIGSDSGAQIRDGVKSVNKLGACKETTWPYHLSAFARKPSEAAFIEAKLHLSVAYARVPQTAKALRACLAAGYPIIFGFSVYEAFESAEVAKTGVLNLPQKNEQQVGGHAVLIVGYDDLSRRFLVRNSWGAEWGQDGYFTMEYAYATNPDLADDFWQIDIVK